MADLNEDDDNESLSQILAELESLSLSSNPNPNSPPPPPLTEPALRSLLSLSSSGDAVSLLFLRLGELNLQISCLLSPLSSSMDSSSSSLSLLASRAYLSLLLSPSAPLFSLFTPLAFLSLLSSVRRSMKSQPQAAATPPVSNPKGHPKGRRKRKELDRDDWRFERGGANLVESVLELLELALGKVPLDAAHDARKSLVETIVSVLELSGSNRISDLCFKILYGVVSRPEHGDQVNSAVEVLKNLTPLILLQVKSPLRTSVLGFVTGKIVPLGRENEKVRKALVYMPRFLACKAPEKSEPRAAAIESILEIVKVMEEEDQIGFVDYVVKMNEGKTNLRLLAVDLILGFFTSFADLFRLTDMEQESEECPALKCLKALIHRCDDSMGGIRARALTNLAHAIDILLRDANNCEELQDVVSAGHLGFKKLLRERCGDEKAAVRKGALLLITKSISLIGRPIDQVILRTMAAACSDSLVSIRKAALMALSEVYRRFPDDRVISEWLHAVPPLIADNETSIQDECESLFLELVLDRICEASKVSLSTDTVDLDSVFPEGILYLLKEICDGEVAPCVKKICANLGKKKKLKASIVVSLQNIISTSETLWLRSSMPIEKWVAPPGAWQLLSEVSLFTPKSVDWKFLHHHWKLLDQANPEEIKEDFDGQEADSFSWAGDRVFLLQTIANVSVELPPVPASELATNLLSRVENFNMNLNEVDAHVKALKILCKRKAVSSEEGHTLVLTWVNQLLTKAFKILDKYVTDIPESVKASTFLTPPSGRRKGKKEASASKSMLKAVTAVFTIGSLILICPSADLQGITPLLHTIITSGNSELKPKQLADFKVSVKEISPSLYIQSWVTMGKVCLIDDKLAKRYIPLFVQELEKSDCAALRNNIMVMMADFCVRYTALVDCYISRITIALRDPCEVVRRQTFVLLSRLLQRDYVKWRGVLFLRFLLSLVDECENIRHLADFLFGSILKVKAPLLAYNSFIEAIFVLNDCNAHSGQSETQGSLPNGARRFSIRGNDEKSRSQRMHIYVSLLKQMAPEHLLATSAKLCAEVLAAASDGLLSIDDAAGQSVLKDALQILSCKEMKIHQSRTSDSHEMDDEPGDSTGALQAARGRVVTHVAKKNLIQNAVPIFIELKRLLESKNSPLIGSLMDCLRSLLKDYKNEFEEILVADKQLQKELMYDMKKYENAKAKSTYDKVIASAHKSRSVLKEVNNGGELRTPPLGSMSVPKLKSATRDRTVAGVLESVRRRETFEFDDEN
ncbi:condensin-2 complex subunit D3 [Asparagus officinalis]|uniref:condensin-2 complex subunit D3 n=1 Tax=Asparagus officinalis TaxID=4686 RepID=UPI00098DF578|nr:condensin-2 complex subunit D3 [Asparagus officinalis]